MAAFQKLPISFSEEDDFNAVGGGTTPQSQTIITSPAAGGRIHLGSIPLQLLNVQACYFDIVSLPPTLATTPSLVANGATAGS